MINGLTVILNQTLAQCVSNFLLYLTRTMVTFDPIFILLFLTFTQAHIQHGETDTHHVSVGRLFLLKCPNVDAHTNVTWSREGGRDPGLPGGVEVRNGLLWFLPVQETHSGTYACWKRGKSGLLNVSFGVSVSSEECPDVSEVVSLVPGISGGIPCKQTQIFSLNDTRTVRWMKDCQPVDQSHISVDPSGFMRLSPATLRDAGKFTCLVEVSVNGRKFTAARSYQLTINNEIRDTLIAEPEMIRPKREEIVVQVGMRKELRCEAYLGFTEDIETSVYWTVNHEFIDEMDEFKEDSFEIFHRNGRVYARSNLSIRPVLRQFLNVNISCHVLNSVGHKVGVVLLKEEDRSELYTRLALCFCPSVAFLLLVAFFLFFKVDLVLAHRKLLRRFSKPAPDGKLYDAYVSFLPPESLSSARTASLAFQILPEELERRHGYSLFIRGRDDCPGEAVHDVISATIRQSRRLIIFVSSDEKRSSDVHPEDSLLHEQNQLCYEQKVGLHDALMHNEPRVILVEMDGAVDYSRLPESLSYIKRKQGALKWRRNSRPNTNSMKTLRYHMPSVPAGPLHTV